MRAYNVVGALDDAGLKVWRLCARAPHHHAQGHLLLHSERIIKKGKYHEISTFYECVLCKKRLATFPSPAGMTLTNFFLGGSNLVCDIPAGDRNAGNLLLRCSGALSMNNFANFN